MSAEQQIEAAIIALEAQRAVLGGAVTDNTLVDYRQLDAKSNWRCK